MADQEKQMLNYAPLPSSNGDALRSLLWAAGVNIIMGVSVCVGWITNDDDYWALAALVVGMGTILLFATAVMMAERALKQMDEASIHRGAARWMARCAYLLGVWPPLGVIALFCILPLHR